MTDQQDIYPDSTAVPFPIEAWLTPKPDRQILVLGVNDCPPANKIDQLAREIIVRYDSKDSGEPTNLSGVVEFDTGDPRSLPYDSHHFDLLICSFLSARMAVTKEGLQEFTRLLRPDGHLLIVDNVVPGSRLRGKKARQLRTAGEYINTWMRLRNSQHKPYLSEDNWIDLLTDAQFNIRQRATLEKPEDFDTWADRYSPSHDDRIRLQAMLVQAPEKVHGFLTPRKSGDRIAFRMTEIFILATMAPNAD
ncbi:MAG: class I SAM-dependent methyltransferase [Candidatus Promineifilaceae bacterium]|jgi:SAM-dependent methyltransferase